MSDVSPQARAQATYDAASDHYDDPALSFWDRFGRRTVERLALAPGQSVLDACCGAGASALPAAEAVGPTGRVLGVDLSERLLARARAKAAARGLAHAEFRRADLAALDTLDESFDAVVCVFGIFFLPDMAAALRGLNARVKPGGTLAITTWGPRLFEPLNGVFWDAIREEASGLYRGFNPWDRICEPASLRDLFADAGVDGAVVEPEAAMHPVASPRDCWSIVLGSGYRGTVEQLPPDARERVRRRVVDRMHTGGVRAIEANVLYGVARR